REPEGAGHPNIVPYQIFPTPTGYLAVAVYGDHFWPGFCRALELPELIADPRYATNEARCQHREPLVALLAARLAPRPREAWVVRRLKSRGVEELLLLACPIKLAEGEPALGAPPALGQHTDEVLAGLLGYD